MTHAALSAVQSRIAAAARAAARDPAKVQLIAVSKTFDAPEIRPVLDAGQRVFGENRVQEAKGKWPALRTAYPDVELHLIGPLQSNKAAEAVALFDAIHTVDRPKIAAALAAEMKKQGRPFAPRYMDSPSRASCAFLRQRTIPGPISPCCARSRPATVSSGSPWA
jgi:PLP dependent protein